MVVATLVCIAKAPVEQTDAEGRLVYYAAPGARVFIREGEQGEALRTRLLESGDWEVVPVAEADGTSPVPTSPSPRPSRKRTRGRGGEADA